MTTIWRNLVWLALVPLFYVLPLFDRPLWQPDESRYAEISREMLEGSSWISPHFLGLRYFEKPIAGYWVNNLGQWLFGDSNFAVRAGSVASTLFAAAIVYWLATRMWRDRRTAFLAVAIYLSFMLVYGIGSYAVLDPIVTLWLVAAMAAFWAATEAETRSGRIVGFLLLGVACGMGFMTKGFLALAVPVIGVLPFVVFTGRWRQLFTYGPLAVLAAAAVSAPWAIAVARAEPDYWHYFFWIEHIQRFADTTKAQHKAPFWYFVPVLIIGSLPWLGLMPSALKLGWSERRRDPASLYLLGFVVMPFLFFSAAQGKLITYLLPCFAPLALLMARRATTLGTPRLFRINGWINVVVGVLLALAVLVVFSPAGFAIRPEFQPDEWGKVALAMVAFLVFAAVGAVTLTAPATRWSWAAVAPIGIALLVGMVIPQSVMQSKTPEWFLRQVTTELADSRYLLAGGPAWASALAWETKRSDVHIYGWTGEVTYGAGYADSAGRFIAADSFPAWLAEHRRDGNVALVLPMRHPDDPVVIDPPADAVIREGRAVLLRYFKQ